MPKKKTFGFKDKEVAEQLKQIAGGGDDAFPIPGGKSPSYILQTPSGGIAPRSGTTVSFANCTVYSIIGTTLTSAGFTLPVGNLSTTAVAGSVYIGAVFMGGALIAVWEDC